MVIIGHWVFSTAATLALGAIAFATPPPVTPSPFRLTGLKLFTHRAVDSTKNSIQNTESITNQCPLPQPSELGTEIVGYAFPETQQVHHLRFQFSTGSEGKRVSLSIFGAKTSLGLEKAVLEFTSEIESSGILDVQVASDANWPIGFYRVEFKFEGKSVGLSAYQVKAVLDRTTPLALKKVTLYTLENSRGVIRSHPKISDHYLEFHAKTEGERTAGAKVTWAFSGLDPTGLIKEPISTREIPNWPLENTVLVHQVERSSDWPVGKYLLEYWVDGAAIGTHLFEMSA